VPRIVVLDGYTLNPGDNPWDDLARLGDLEIYDRSPPDTVVERARGAEIVLTNKTPLDASVLAQLPDLRLIGVLATGYNIVDTVAAAARGIVVSHVPEYGTDSVAQHVFALLLELCQHTGGHARAVRDGAWLSAPDFCFWQAPIVELAGLTFGIVGMGRIGRRVATLAQAFGMHVLVTGSARREVPDGITWGSIDEVFSQADVVSLHCPLTPANHGFVDRTLLRRMKPTGYLINTARGPLVVEADLAVALRAGWLAGAGLDVVSVEPMRADNPLRGAPNCVITPHIAWASLAARRRLMQTTVRNVEAFLAGQPIHVVNGVCGPVDKTPAT